MQHCHPELFGVCLDIYAFVLSQLNSPTGGLRFIQVFGVIAIITDVFLPSYVVMVGCLHIHGSLH